MYNKKLNSIYFTFNLTLFLLIPFISFMLTTSCSKKNTIPVANNPVSVTTLQSPISATPNSAVASSTVSATPSTQSNGAIPPAIKPPSYGNASGSSAQYCSTYGIDLPGTQAIDNYYSFPIISHGLNSRVVWSSVILSSDEQNKIRTGKTLAIRVVAKPAPSYCKLSDFPPPAPTPVSSLVRSLPYKELQFYVGVRSQLSSTFFESIQFSGLKVNECTPVKYFSSLPYHNESEPLILEIYNIKSDYYCVTNPPPNAANESTICPYSKIPDNSCFELELQVATDLTKRIPE